MSKLISKLSQKIILVTRHNLFPYLLVIVLSIPAFSFFLKPGVYWNMHDDMQMIRQLEFEKCIFDGQIPCRWTPDLGYGYGYPLFNFYPPLPYIIGQVFRSFSFDFMTTVKLTAALQFVLAVVFMYLLVSSVFGRLGGILSALFYTYAPYHALNVYIRGAMNEAWASVFFPLIFYFSRKLILEKKIKYTLWLALSFSFLLLSHNPMVMTFTPILLVWCLFWILTQYNKKNSFLINLSKSKSIFFKLFLSGIFALCLSAFFTLPVLFETKYVSVETMFTGYYHFSAHFASILQLFFSNFWGDGGSIWGPNDGMSFMIGYLHWIVPILVAIGSLVYLIKTKKINYKISISLIFVAIGFFAAFMSHERSTFLWLLITPIQKVQFPWRFLNHSVFAFSFAVGVLPFLLQNLFKLKSSVIKILISLLILILFFLNKNYFYPIHSGPITDDQKFSGLSWQNQITASIYDYLPKTAKIAAQGPAKDFIDEIFPSDSIYQISNAKKGTDWQSFNLHLNSPATVTLPILSFPKFKVFDNTSEINYTVDPQLGRIKLDLSTGNHQIFVRLYNTPIRTISNYLSLFSWLLVLFFTVKTIRWKKNPGKK